MPSTAAPAPVSASAATPLRAHWLTEAVRLREVHWGPLDDEAELRTLRARQLPLEAALLARGVALAGRHGFDQGLRSWLQAARWTVLLMGVVAMLAGVGAASAALGDGSRPVNLPWAFGGLLGLHLLTFLAWIIGLAWALARGPAAGDVGGGMVARVTLALSRRVARGPAAAQMPQALAGVLGRARLLPWALGAASHAWWLIALGAALATLLMMLATRRYDFVWETTILPEGWVLAMAQGLAALPAWLGLPAPGVAALRGSVELASGAGAGRAALGAWLMATVLVYGLLPRGIALLWCLWRLRRGLRRLRLDPSLPALDGVAARLAPAAARTGVIDAAPAEPWQPAARAHADAAPAVEPGLPPGGRWWVGVELPADAIAALPPLADAADLGGVDGGAQRAAALARLEAGRPARLLIVCDGRQTPDRGTVALIAELAAEATQARVWPLLAPGAATDRRAAWQARLGAAGLAVLADADAAQAWLRTAGEAAHG